MAVMRLRGALVSCSDVVNRLTDDEIALFQQLDEKEAEAESNGEDFDRTAEKARLSAAD